MFLPSQDTFAFQHGRPEATTAFVLSCPGRLELKRGYPAAGQTGSNLDRLLAHLNAARPQLFPFLSRRDYRIVNAVDKVLHLREHRRTEAYLREVREPSNLEWLRCELEGSTFVVALGQRAKLALAVAGIAPGLHGPHPSLQCLNRRYEADGSTAEERSEQRIMRYAQDVLSSIAG
jgi:uracil-DNA glycosylase